MVCLWHSIFVMVSLCATHAQSIYNMTFAGHERQYYVSMPPNKAAPTGLIIALTPDTIAGAQKFCTYYLGDVPAQTGAIVICPAARTFNSTFPGHPGKGGAPCWLSFANYGYCNGAPESSEDGAAVPRELAVEVGGGWAGAMVAVMVLRRFSGAV